MRPDEQMIKFYDDVVPDLIDGRFPELWGVFEWSQIYACEDQFAVLRKVCGHDEATTAKLLRRIGPEFFDVNVLARLMRFSGQMSELPKEKRTNVTRLHYRVTKLPSDLVNFISLFLVYELGLVNIEGAVRQARHRENRPITPALLYRSFINSPPLPPPEWSSCELDGTYTQPSQRSYWSPLVEKMTLKIAALVGSAKDMARHVGLAHRRATRPDFHSELAFMDHVRVLNAVREAGEFNVAETDVSLRSMPPYAMTNQARGLIFLLLTNIPPSRVRHPAWGDDDDDDFIDF
jgi:hypothetical protein